MSVRYTKLFPNIFQIMFMENFNKQSVNSLFKSKMKVIKERGEEFFDKYQKESIQNVKKIYDYQNKLFNVRVSNFIIQYEYDGQKYMLPTNTYSKILKFLNHQKIKTFTNKQYAYVLENGLPATRRGGEGTTSNNQISLKILNGELSLITEKSLEEYFEGPIYEKNIKSLATLNVYREYHAEYMLLPIEKDIILYDNTEIPHYQKLSIGKYDIYRKIEDERPDIEPFIPIKNVPTQHEIPKNTFSEYIGTKNADEDFIDNPLVKQLNRGEQAQKRFEKLFDKKIINKKKEHDKLQITINEAKKINKQITEDQVNKIKALKKELYYGSINNYKRENLFLKKLAAGDIHDKINKKAKNIDLENANLLTEFADRFTMAYNNEIVSNIKNITTKSTPEEIAISINAINDVILVFLEDIKKSTGNLFVIQGTLQQDDITEKLTKLIKQGESLLDLFKDLDKDI